MIMALLSLSYFLMPHGFADVVLPLHGVEFCQDSYFPNITEDWILYCDSQGKKDSLWLRSERRRIELPESEYWLLGDQLFRVGVQGGAWNWKEERFEGSRILLDPSEYSSFSGRAEKAAVMIATERRILFLDREQGKQFQTEANPIGWHPPVRVGDEIFWIEWSGSEQEIAVWNWKTNQRKSIQASEPLFLVASGHYLAWIERRNIVILDWNRKKERRITAQAQKGISLLDDRVCWSEQGTNDFDIHCSDGFHLQRKGDQFWPIQLQDGLFFREKEELMWLKY